MVEGRKEIVLPTMQTFAPGLAAACLIAWMAADETSHTVLVRGGGTTCRSGPEDRSAVEGQYAQVWPDHAKVSVASHFHMVS